MRIPTVKPLDPPQGQLIYDELQHQFEIFTGVTWHQLHVRVCVMCKMSEIGHLSIDGHPLCESTLDYLEWEYERRVQK